MAGSSRAVPTNGRGARSLARRALALSTARVAPGGETGWWRWLLPALVVLVVAFAALSVRSATQQANDASALATRAQAFNAAVDQVHALVLAVEATHGDDAPVVGQLAGARRDLVRRLADLQRQAPENPQVQALATAAGPADASVHAVVAAASGHRPADAERVARTVAGPGVQRLDDLARGTATSLASDAHADQANERRRMTLTLGAGLLLAALLMWTFWAKRSRQAVERSERRLHSLVAASRDVVVVVDDDHVIRFITPVVERRLGHSAGELIGTPLLDLVHPDDRAGIDPAAERAGEHTPQWRIRHQDGTWRATEVEWQDAREDPAINGWVVTMQDVTERKELRDQLQWQAFHDALTGLPNRVLFEDRVAHALERLRRHGYGTAVLFIDLDDFKTVNDSLGHAPGDELLRAFAIRLAECTRRADTAARFGGDEFAVLVEGPEAAEAAAQVAERIYEALERPFQVDADELFVHASVGIAEGTAELTAEELVRNADIAMYAAKTSGKHRSATFEPSMHSAARRRLQLSGDLRRAVRDGHFSVKYQPLVRLDDGRMLGAEALVRWDHDALGQIAPDDFIGLAEETGLIIPIGRYVLREACRQLADWRRRFPDAAPDYVSVNLSMRQFHPEGRIVEEVRTAADAAGLDPRHLMLEVTESVLMQDREAIVRDLTALRNLGARIAIDDFGTGYSALSYLRDFPIDIVKMDRSFIHDLGEGKADSALIRSVIELGEALEMQIVAEGIEGQDQLDSLTGLRCDIGQGYYFAPPLDAEDIGSVLGGERPTPGREDAASL